MEENQDTSCLKAMRIFVKDGYLKQRRTCLRLVFYVQRSYIVNLKYIESVNSREIMLCNGLKIAIGRVHGKEFKKEFFKWRMLLED